MIINISRLNNRREVKVEADLADQTLDLPPILDEIEKSVLPEILSKVQGVKASFEGQSRSQAKVVNSMRQAFPIAFIAMFILD